MPVPKQPIRLPDILSQEEVERLIQCADSPLHRVCILVRYARGRAAKSSPPENRRHPHTIARGRRQLLEQDVEVDRIRQPGAGRKAVEKKHLK